MNGHANPPSNRYDVLIIGAGISGINAAYRLQTTLPDARYAILEGRENLGGTWDLFKYPGIRSDSDLHTFGFPFYPWQKSNPIATGESILEYMQDTASHFGIDKHFNFETNVISANWSSDQQLWQLEVEKQGLRTFWHAQWVIMGTGYYDYNKPLDAHIPGLENFEGLRVHPQFWPKDLEFEGKRIIVVGSGATAITLLPALAEKAGSVTMLQRSPSYIMSLPQPEPGSLTWYQRLLPRWLSLKITRLQFLIIPYLFYRFCRTFPNAARRLLMGQAAKQLPKDYPMDPHFKPTYNPWDQRMCLCPDGDFFKCFHDGKANVVTAHVKQVQKDGILLESGEKLDADIIITATGLNMRMAGGIQVSVDNTPISFPSKFMWRYSMLQDVPNLAFIIGYTNAPWTLGSDATARLIVRLMKYEKDKGFTSAAPALKNPETIKETPVLNLTSTYMKAALHKFPKTGDQAPWLPRDNYFRDNYNANWSDLTKGLVFKKVST